MFMLQDSPLLLPIVITINVLQLVTEAMNKEREASVELKIDELEEATVRTAKATIAATPSAPTPTPITTPFHDLGGNPS